MGWAEPLGGADRMGGVPVLTCFHEELPGSLAGLFIKGFVAVDILIQVTELVLVT